MDLQCNRDITLARSIRLVLSTLTQAVPNRIADKFRVDDLDLDQTEVRKSELLSVV